MNHRGAFHRVGAVVAIVIALALLGSAGYGIFLLLKWFAALDDINPTIIAALIVGAITTLTSVFIVSYNAGRAQERAAQEANRGTKAALYNTFLESMLKATRSQKSGGQSEQGDIEESLIRFASQLMVYGGPEVVKACSNWRTMAANPNVGATNDNLGALHLAFFEKLLRAMRNDLGVSNKGIEENELLGLLITGGKDEIDRALKNA